MSAVLRLALSGGKHLNNGGAKYLKFLQPAAHGLCSSTGLNMPIHIYF